MVSLDDIGKQFNRHSGAEPQVFSGLKRAQEELDEAFAALEAWDAAWPCVLEEMADVVLTLASLAARYGRSLDEVIAAKHAKNLTRQWAPHPTIPGAVQHVKEPK